MKVNFTFLRGVGRCSGDYEDYVEEVIRTARFVTYDFGKSWRKCITGTVVTNAQCDDSFCCAQRFKSEEELVDWLHDEGQNGWLYDDDEEINIEIGSRVEGNFYLRRKVKDEEDYVLQVIFDFLPIDDSPPDESQPESKLADGGKSSQ